MKIFLFILQIVLIQRVVGTCITDYFPLECGKSETVSDRAGKIVGGVNAKKGEFPYSALIGYPDKFVPDVVLFGCGGSLINQRYVLTAGHCLMNPRTGKLLSVKVVRLGEHDFDSSNPDKVDIEPEELIPHPHFDIKSESTENDISFIRLSRNVEFTKYILPVCLPLQIYSGTYNLESGTITTATGWGSTTDSFGLPSTTLKKADLEIVDIGDCVKHYKYPPEAMHANLESNICATLTGNSQCNGDSGGPLVIKQMTSEQRYIQIGVASFGGQECDGGLDPSVCTDVKYYMKWIQETMVPFCEEPSFDQFSSYLAPLVE